VYLLIFLVTPTITVVVGAFQENGRFSLVNIKALFDSTLSPRLLSTQALTMATPGDTVRKRVGRQESASDRAWRWEVAVVMNQP